MQNKRLLIIGIVIGLFLYSVGHGGILKSKKAAWHAAEAQMDDFAAYDRDTQSEAYSESLRKTRLRRFPFHLLRLVSLLGSGACAFLLARTYLREKAESV